MGRRRLKSASVDPFAPAPPGKTSCGAADPMQQRAELFAAKVRAECEKDKRKVPMCVAAVRDKATGKVYYAESGPPPLKLSQAHPKLGMPLKSKEPWDDPGNCAEPKAINKALLDGARKENLQVAAVNTLDGTPKQCCRNCEVTTRGTTVSPASLKKAKPAKGSV